MDLAVITAILAGVATSPVAAIHHRGQAGWLLALVVLLVLLYVGWRTGRLGRLRSSAEAWRVRGELKGVRLRPVALLPTVLLVIVVLVLLIDH